jgi:hypothetical protein
MLRKLVLGMFLVCTSGEAKNVGEYRLEVALGNAGREPAMLISPEEGWQCRAVGMLDFQETDRAGEVERVVTKQVVGQGEFQEVKRVALRFRRNLGSRVASARFLLRANCRRDGARAWVSWTCSVGDRLPEKLWHAQVNHCEAARFAVPGNDPQSQLLIGLRNRPVTATITLVDRVNVDESRLSFRLP